MTIRSALYAGVCLVTLTTGPVSADPDARGWYVGLDTGTAALDLRRNHVTGITVIDDRAAKIGIELGYRFNPYLMLELAYQDVSSLGGFSTFCPPDFACIASFAPLDVRADSKAYSLSILPVWPVHERIALTGKIGLFHQEIDVSDPVPGYSKQSAVLGVGVLGHLNDHWTVKAGVEQADDLEIASVGLRWSF